MQEMGLTLDPQARAQVCQGKDLISVRVLSRRAPATFRPARSDRAGVPKSKRPPRRVLKMSPAFIFAFTSFAKNPSFLILQRDEECRLDVASSPPTCVVAPCLRCGLGPGSGSGHQELPVEGEEV